ncbi:MAG TPA: hypothetical protein VLS96_16525 [Nodosilinea sp.]|nr:hypothetical protein [Nodosilinea sp.]
MTVSTSLRPSVQCPECGSHSIVEYKPTVYRCLRCDFEKDLSAKPQPERTGLEAMVMGLAGFGLVLVMLL